MAQNLFLSWLTLLQYQFSCLCFCINKQVCWGKKICIAHNYIIEIENFLLPLQPRLVRHFLKIFLEFFALVQESWWILPIHLISYEFSYTLILYIKNVSLGLFVILNNNILFFLYIAMILFIFCWFGALLGIMSIFLMRNWKKNCIFVIILNLWRVLVIFLHYLKIYVDTFATLKQIPSLRWLSPLIKLMPFSKVIRDDIILQLVENDGG